MNNNIEIKAKEIIKDLILLDPELKSIESELNKIVIDFIKNKPELIINKEFEQELKSILIEKIKIIKEKGNSKNMTFNKEVFFKKLAFSLGAIILALVVVLPTINFFNNKTPDLTVVKKGETLITRLDDSAFGSLVFQANENQKRMESEVNLLASGPSKEMFSEIATSNDSSFAVNDSPQRILGLGSAGSVGSDISILPYFEYPRFSYIYEGDDLGEIISNEEKIDVYKRIKTSYSNSSLLSSITSLANDLINLKKFNNNQTKISHLSLTEEKDFGYIINFDLGSGNLSLYQNWNRWPQSKINCYDEACFSANRFKYQDLLSTEEAIKIAEKFLLDFGVNRNNYSEAVVNYNFHTIYAASNNKAELYVPEETTVVFPLLIEGKEIKDEGGEAYGLYVSVSSRYKMVTGLNNLLANSYEVSAYEALNDVEEVKRLAEQGGINRYQDSLASKEIIVRLGTPSMILSRQYIYNNGYSDELFVSALSFPVLGLSEESDFFYQKNVVIPLVKELIKNNNSGGVIMPYPAIDLAR